jgi:chromosome segregation ATPase
MLENFEDTVKEANNEIISEVNLLKEKMTGDKGVLTKIGSSSNEAAEALDKVSEATNNLTSATEQLFESFGADNEKMQKALDKLAEYETQLRSTQNTTSNLAQQLNQANQTISSKNAQAQNFQTIIDIKTGVQDFKKGEIYTLKKGAYVSYHRDGKSQIDEKNKTGFKLEKDMKVKIYEVGEKPTNGNPVKYGIRIFEAGKTPHEETYVPKNQKIQA